MHRLLYGFLFGFILSGISTATLATEQVSCEISEEQIDRYLTLSFEAFDQTIDSGWRPFYENRCYETAAKLLVRYIEAHPDLAEAHYMLAFHSGQMYALDGQYTTAIAFMKQGYSDIPSTFVDWNAFVDANIAFLENDFEGLQEKKALIEMQPPLPDGPGVPEWAVGRKMNLDVVEGFVNCFDESYETAYSKACRSSD